MSGDPWRGLGAASGAVVGGEEWLLFFFSFFFCANDFGVDIGANLTILYRGRNLLLHTDW